MQAKKERAGRATEFVEIYKAIESEAVAQQAHRCLVTKQLLIFNVFYPLMGKRRYFFEY
jgi:hypothetical protein